MRYLPLTNDDRKNMKKVIGISDINEMFTNVPKEVSLDPKFNLPNHKTEMEVGKILSEIANKNINSNQVPFFLGAGAYKHHIPATVDHIIQRSEFLTSYTPYQPEISQGTLQYLFEFQTQVSLITGMDVSNASMYDGSTSTAEAVSMAKRITKRNKVVLSPTLHPQYAEVINTLISSNEDEIDYEFSENFEVEKLISKIDDSVSCIVVQNPDFFGSCHSLEQLAEYAHSKGALLIVVVNEIISLGMMKSPGAMGADIVACEGQSLGNPLNFGGPYIGLMSTKDKYVRQLPGRIVGETIDMNGENAKLNYKEQLFCNAYANNGGNGKNAVISAGYSENGASVQATRLLAKVKIRGEIERQKNYSILKQSLTKEKIINEQFELYLLARSNEEYKTASNILESLTKLLGYAPKLEDKQIQHNVRFENLLDTAVNAKDITPKKPMISVVESWVQNSWQSCHTQLNQRVSGESLLPPKRSRRLVSDIEEDRVNSIQRVKLGQQFMENLPVHRGEARSHNIFRDDRT